MRSGGRWAVAVLLLAGVVFAWPTYVRWFGLHPIAMAAALLVYAAVANTLVMNLFVWPILLWGIRRSADAHVRNQLSRAGNWSG